MSTISHTPQRIRLTAKKNFLRQQCRDRIQAEVVWAKSIQKQTGCTWTEALRASAKAAHNSKEGT